MNDKNDKSKNNIIIIVVARLPPSLQQYLLLEWLSPESVWVLVRVSGVLRRCVLRMRTTATAAFSSFRADVWEVLSDACIRWFREQGLPLRLFNCVVKGPNLDFVNHFYNGKKHRDNDLPAEIDVFGTQSWYQRGKLHRDGDKPAVVFRDGRGNMWYQRGKLHRDGDKPAKVWAGLLLEWYQHGELHREGCMPAVIGEEIMVNGVVIIGRKAEWYDRGQKTRPPTFANARAVGEAIARLLTLSQEEEYYLF